MTGPARRRVKLSSAQIYLALPILFLLHGLAAGCTEKSQPIRPWGDADYLIYVDASIARKADAPVSGSGSKDSPFATIGEAIAAAEEGPTGSKGTAILVAPGVYEEAVLVRTQQLSNPPLTIFGWAEDSASIATFELRPPIDSQAGIMLVGPGGGVPESVKLVGVNIVEPTSVGIWVYGVDAELSTCTVVRTRSTLEQPFGYGILATAGGVLRVTDSRVEESDSVGILVQGAQASLRKSVVEDNAGGGVRFELSNEFTVESCTLEDNQVFGIAAFSSTGTIQDSTIQNTKKAAEEDSGQSGADGIVVGELVQGGTEEGPSAVHIERNTVTGSGRVGVLFSSGTSGEVVDNVVNDNQRGGIWLQLGGGGDVEVEEILVRANEVLGNGYVGIGATHGVRVTIMENVVGGSTPGFYFEGVEMKPDFGDGIGVYEGSFASILGNTLSKSGRVDVLLDSVADGTTVDATNQREAGSSEQFAVVLQDPLPDGEVSVELQTEQWVDYQQADPGTQFHKLTDEAEQGYKALVGPGGGVPEFNL